MELDADLPGSGKHYCISCSRYFTSDAALVTHNSTKPHKRRYDMRVYNVVDHVRTNLVHFSMYSPRRCQSAQLNVPTQTNSFAANCGAGFQAEGVEWRQATFTAGRRHGSGFRDARQWQQASHQSDGRCVYGHERSDGAVSAVDCVVLLHARGCVLWMNNSRMLRQ